jgi:RHS repeat-associated protein
MTFPPGTNREDWIMTAQIVKANWYKYDESGANPTAACESGAYYYFYDALGNPDRSRPSVYGVLEEKNGLYHYYKWEMDAFGNDLPGGNDFLAMDQSGPKEHLTGKMYDTVTGLYYFHARWYDPEAGRFVGRDTAGKHSYVFTESAPTNMYDPDGNEPYVYNRALGIWEDIHFTPCDQFTHITSKEVKKCSRCEVEKFRDASIAGEKYYASILAAGPPYPPAVFMDIKLYLGYTTYRDELHPSPESWTPYCNTNKVEDPCNRFCTCEHERVHKDFGPPNRNTTYESRLRNEVKGYQTGTRCATLLLTRLGDIIQP